MKRILFVFGGSPEDASNRYRCRNVCERLATAGWQPEWASADQNAVVVCHDLVVLHRLPWGVARPWIEAARAIGSGVLYSADDLVFDEEFANHKGILHPGDPLQRRAAQRSVEGMQATIEQSDGILVSTEFLAREAAEFGKPIIVLRNCPSDDLIRRSEAAHLATMRHRATRSDDRVLLGYFSGSATHDSDFAEIAGSLSKTLARFPQARLLVVGDARVPDLLSNAERAGKIQRHPFVAWRELPALLSSTDINLSPLDLTRPFCHAKSEVKWLEAAAVGVPTIGSAASGLREALAGETGAILCKSDADYEQALADLVADATGRHQSGVTAKTELTQRVKVAAELESEALSPFVRSASGSQIVRRTPRARFWSAFWRSEETFFRRAHYLRRHLQEVSDRTRNGL